MIWSFALVNGKLAEVFFKNKKGTRIIEGHCYVKTEEYKMAREKRWIKIDTARYRFTYKKGQYSIKTKTA